MRLENTTTSRVEDQSTRRHGTDFTRGSEELRNRHAETPRIGDAGMLTTCDAAYSFPRFDSWHKGCKAVQHVMQHVEYIHIIEEFLSI
jgi:hypothetical protein